MKSFFNSLILLLISFSISSCNKEVDCDTVISYSVSDDTKKQAIAPLTGYDTFRFLFNNTDTQIYVGQGVKSAWIYEVMRTPGECDQKYEYLIYNYNCINHNGFSFRMEYYPYSLSWSLGQLLPTKYYFNNTYAGDYLIPSTNNDSLLFNNSWFHEPEIVGNGPDTIKYFMFCNLKKNPGYYFLKIKYPNSELTLLK